MEKTKNLFCMEHNSIQLLQISLNHQKSNNNKIHLPVKSTALFSQLHNCRPKSKQKKSKKETNLKEKKTN